MGALPLGGLLIWFLFVPGLSLGMAAGANLELNLIQAWLLVLVIMFVIWACVDLAGRGWRSFWRNVWAKICGDRFLWVFAAFVAWNWLSLIWTANLTRGFLAAGIISLVFGLALIIKITVLDRDEWRLVMQRFWTAFLVGGAISCLFGLWQVFGEALGVSSTWTLLPTNYQSGVFGFARPLAFMQEPQFLANLLMVGILGLVGRDLFGLNEKSRRRKMEMILLAMMVVVGVLTISRGAFAAILVGILVLFGVFCFRKKYQGKLRRIAENLGILAVAGILGLVLVGFSAQINRSNQVSFGEAISGWVNQMSLGLIDLPINQKERVNDGCGGVGISCPSDPTIPEVDYDAGLMQYGADDGAIGYVEASTDERAHSNDMALRAVVDHPMVGVGIGGSGQYRYDNYGEPNNASINYNEYLEIWSELGSIGAILFVFLLILAVKRATKLGQVLMVGVLVQWLFFAGYPNSLPVLILLVFMLQWGYEGGKLSYGKGRKAA